MSRRAKIRGLPQLGTLGAGNHYAEIQVVEEVFDKQAAKRMGIDRVGQVRTGALPVRAILTRCFRIFLPCGAHRCRFARYHVFRGIFLDAQVCIMIHSGSRGLGHQVATDALVQMEAAMDRDKIKTNDRQLACAKINSKVMASLPVRWIARKACNK